MIPKETILWARETSRRIREVATSDSPEDFIEATFQNLTHKYGFVEALIKDNYFPWPHELESVVCSSQTFAEGIVLRENGYDVKVHEFYGLKRDDHSSFADHCLISVKQGEDMIILNSQYGLFGPIIEWDDHSFTIENKERNKKERYVFHLRLDNDFSDYAERYANFRDSEELNVLMEGQRLAHASNDTWKIEKPLRTDWFIRYDKEDNSYSTLIGIDRPITQNRGLEMKVQLDDCNEITSKTLLGYYFGEMQWAKFKNAIPMFEASLEEVANIPDEIMIDRIEEQLEFEKRMMEGDISQHLKDMIKSSYDNLKDSLNGKVFEMITAVEALYQDARDKEFIYPKNIHDSVLGKLKNSDPFVKALYEIATTMKKKDLCEKYRQQQHRVVVRGRSAYVLDTSRLPSAEEMEANLLDEPLSHAIYLAGKNPYFVREACDRFKFVEHRLSDVKNSYDTLMDYARENLSNFENDMLKGYSRIFAEFIGHMSNSISLLDTTFFDDNIIGRIKQFSE